MTADVCDHGDKPWRCPTCCLAELRRNLPRLEKAVRGATRGNANSGSPGFGSRVPAGFSVSAFALLQDIRQHGGLDIIEAQLTTLRDPERLEQIRRTLRQWRSRASLILSDALAPYPLRWPVYGPLWNPDGTPVLNDDGQQQDGWRDQDIPCPVVSDDGDCAAPLLVHRDNDPDSPNFGKPESIRCRRDDTHEWTLAHGGWLRLGVLLGGTVNGTMGETA